jgi:hypothetical protein
MHAPSRGDEPEPCSLCGAARDTQAGRATAAPRPRIGRAFQECWRCGRRIARPGITEWDFHPPAARRRIVLGRAGFALLGGPVVLLAYVGVTLTTTRAWSSPEAGIALGAGWLAIGIWESARLFGEIHRSRLRVVHDPMYRARLIEQGITESRGGRDALGAVSSPDADGEQARA